MASIEFSIKFRSSCCSSFKAWNGLEALLNLVIELLSSASTQGTIFLRNIFEANNFSLSKLQDLIQWEKNLARIQILVRILQESCKFLNSGKFICV